PTAPRLRRSSAPRRARSPGRRRRTPTSESRGRALTRVPPGRTHSGNRPGAPGLGYLAVRIAVSVLWGALGLYWLAAAAGPKPGSHRGRNVRAGQMAIVAVIVLR